MLNQTVNVAFPCVKCGTSIPVEMGVAPKMLNLETVSMIIVEHTGQVVCPGCATVVRPGIAAPPAIAMALVPVPVQDQKQVVGLPGNVII